MNKTTTFFVEDISDNLRLDKYLASKLKTLTRSQIKKIILSKNVSINKKTTLSPSKKLKSGNSIEIIIKEKKVEYIKPQKIDIDIIFEDDEIIVVDKPSGIVVHPGAGNKEGTLVNALLYLYKKKLSNLNGLSRPGIVHRIDKETSGLLVIAKTNFSHAKIAKQFSDHTVKRKYLALIWGVIRPLSGKITTLLSRNKKNRQLMSVTERAGKKAVTNYKTLKVFVIKNIPKISLLECELETGRTHQIRVHINHKGSSLLGDKQYGKKNLKFKNINKNFLEALENLDGQALHAQTLEFIHPTKNFLVKFESKIPRNLKKILNILEDLTS